MKSNVKRANTKNVTHQQWMQDHPYQQPKTTHFSRITKEDASFYFRQTSKKNKLASSSSRVKAKTPTPIPVWNDRFHRDDIDESGPVIHRRRPSNSTTGPKINPNTSTLSIAEADLGTENKNDNIMDDISEPADKLTYRPTSRQSETRLFVPSNPGKNIRHDEDYLAIKSYVDRANRSTSPISIPVDPFLPQRYGVKGWSARISRDKSPVPNSNRTSVDSRDGQSPLKWCVSRNGVGRITSESPKRTLSPTPSFDCGEKYADSLPTQRIYPSAHDIPESKMVPIETEHFSGEKEVSPKPVGVTRSTSPIDEKIIRLVLGQKDDMQTDMNFECNPSSNYERVGYELDKEKTKLSDLLSPLLPHQNSSSSSKNQEPVESVMLSMARVMEAVEGIVRNGYNKENTAKKQRKITKKKPLSSQSLPNEIERENDKNNVENFKSTELKSLRSTSAKKNEVMDLILAKIQVRRIETIQFFCLSCIN